MNRRDFLAASAALAVAPILPAPVGPTAEPPVRVFQFGSFGDCEWIAARSMEEAREFLLRDGILSQEDIEDMGCKELTAKQMRKRIRTEERDEGPCGIDEKRFVDALRDDLSAGVQVPYTFASTNW